MVIRVLLSTFRFLPALLLLVAVTGTAGATEWRTYAGGPRRLFFNPAETTITSANVGRLEVKWKFPTGAIVTASPSVASLDIPGEGRMPIAFIQSWDSNLYALRVRNGTEVWRFEADEQYGKSFPNAASVDVREIDGRERVYLPAGETVYCIDAATGAEIWRFDAGTGCVDPPGLCGFDTERNEVESSPIVAEGKLFFGMDVNDVEVGKGGLYAIDARDGRLVWFFDLETGATCRPLPEDNIRRFDGYHTEEELGLPAGFFASRPGCDFDRSSTGCANIWSSAAIDESRRTLYIASSNCDTDDDPGTSKPPPPMPPYDEAIFAVDFGGNPVWRWRPREVDNGDLAFGGVPNLFTINVEVDGSPVPRDAVGVGNKDGTYYVIDRDGTNVANGVRWDDPDPSSLPYWSNQVVPGGAIGGVIATAAVDETRGRIYFSTAPGINPLVPQQPTVHALDMHTGAIIWQNTGEADADASYAPTSAVPGAVFVGSVVGGFLRAYDPETGEKLKSVPVGFAAASAPAVVDGTAIVGAGIGERTADPNDIQNIVSWIPHNVTAFCVPGTPACQRLSPFSCYKARETEGSSGFDPIPGVTLADRLSTRTASVEEPRIVCNPADKNGEDPAIPWDPDHLKGYKVKRRSDQPRFKRIRDIQVVNDFGTTVVNAIKPDRLLVPSAMSLVDDPPDLPASVGIDHFQCYKVRRAKGTAKFQKIRGLPLVDEFGAITVDVTRPKRLCAPVDKNGEAPTAKNHTDYLMCYRIKVTRGTSRFTRVSPVFVNNQLGPETLDALRPDMLCVPSQISGPSLPTTSTTSTTSTTTVPTTSTTSTTVVFTWAQAQAVLDDNCSMCHGGEPGAGGLGGLDDFDQGYDNLVNAPSTQVPAMVLVAPGDSLASYLMHKIDGTHELVGGTGSAMPLLPGDANGVRAWINSGAPKSGSPCGAFIDGAPGDLFGLADYR